jgi:hypothetical protein
MSATPANNEIEIYLAIITHGQVRLLPAPGGTAVIWRGRVEHLYDVVSQLRVLIDAARFLATIGGQSCAWTILDVSAPVLPHCICYVDGTDEAEHLLFVTPLSLRYHVCLGAGVLCAVET